jgi:hypothetical protein
MGPTQPIEWVPDTGLEAEKWAPSGSENNEWSYTSTPPYASSVANQIQGQICF